MISRLGGRRPASFCVRCWRARERLADLDWLLDAGLLGTTLEALVGRVVTATTAVDATDRPTLGTDCGAAMDACSCWSGTGNARSSCSKEIMESRSREIA